MGAFYGSRKIEWKIYGWGEMNKPIEIKNDSGEIEWKIEINSYGRIFRWENKSEDNIKLIHIIKKEHRYEFFHTSLIIPVIQSLKEILNQCPKCQAEIPERVKTTIKAVILNLKFK